MTGHTTVPTPGGSGRNRSLWRRNLLVWAALLVLLGLSCASAYQPLAGLNAAAGLAIAGIKAGLVGFIFMKLGRGPGLLRLAATAGFFWLVILFGLTLSDEFARLAML